MLLIYLTIPNSSFIGHFCGILAGLLIKFAGLYVFMPRYEWIEGFDEVFEYYLRSLGYCEAKREIENDFDSYMWKTMFGKITHWFNKLRQRFFGYQYIRPMPEIICADSIEM